MPEPSVFVVFEGIDGAGKSTQIALLKQALEEAGEVPVVSREPTDGPWGRKIRESASSGRMPLAEELEAFLNDRAEHVAQVIAPALAAGRIVILDRYYYSTIAYQGSRGADVGKLTAEMEARFPRPDIVLLLDVDPRESVHRIAHGRQDIPNEFERVEGLERARAIFHAMADDRIVRIDASAGAESVHRAVVAAVVGRTRLGVRLQG